MIGGFDVAVLTKEQVEFMLEEGLKIRMENMALQAEVKRLENLRITEVETAVYDRGYDDGYRACREFMKG